MQFLKESRKKLPEESWKDFPISCRILPRIPCRYSRTGSWKSLWRSFRRNSGKVPDGNWKTVLEAIAEVVHERIPEEVPAEVPKEVLGGISEEAFRAFSKGYPQWVSESIPKEASEETSGGISHEFLGGSPGRHFAIPERIFEVIPREIPQEIFGKVSENTWRIPKSTMAGIRNGSWRNHRKKSLRNCWRNLKTTLWRNPIRNLFRNLKKNFCRNPTGSFWMNPK